jgi:hypothetical protein
MVGAKSAPPGAVSDIQRGKIMQDEGQSSAPEPSLTVSKDKEELFRLIDDYHKGKIHKDENGRMYKVSPSTRQKIYLEA